MDGAARAAFGLSLRAGRGMSLSAECEHCGGRLVAPDASYGGRRVRCPRCREATVFRPAAVAAVGSSDATPAAVWIGFGLLGAAVLGLAVAFFAGSIGRIGGRVAAAVSNLASDDPARPVLEWLPRRSDATFVVRLEDVLRSDLLAPARRCHVGLEVLGVAERSVGVDLMKVTWLAGARKSAGGVAIDEWDELAPGAAAAAEPWEGDWVFAMTSRVPFDGDKLAEHDTPVRHRGATYFRPDADADPAELFAVRLCHFLPDPKTLVIGGEDAVRGLIERGPLSELPSRPRLRTGGLLTVESETVDWLTPLLGGVDADAAALHVSRMDSSFAGELAVEAAGTGGDVANSMRRSLRELRDELADLDLRWFGGGFGGAGFGGGFGGPVGRPFGPVGVANPLFGGAVGTTDERDRALSVIDAVSVIESPDRATAHLVVPAEVVLELFGLD